MDTPHLVPIARAADIAEGMILRVADTPAGPLAIVRMEDGYHALRDRCPHAAARLSEGFIDGRAVVCPTHFAAFDVVTGVARDAPKSCPACSRCAAGYMRPSPPSKPPSLTCW